MLEELQKKLVYSIINNYSTVENKDDLFQVGMIGAINAYQKYDSSSGVKYSTYAYKYILGEVLKYLRENRLIKLNRDIISDYKKINFAKEYIYKTYGKVSDEKLSKILNMSKERIDEVLSYNESTLSLNKLIMPSEDLTIEDMVSSKDMNIEDHLSLKDAIKSLDKDEQELIYDRYFNELTQTDIAKEKNMTQVKVYRLERKILNKLKDKMT